MMLMHDSNIIYAEDFSTIFNGVIWATFQETRQLECVICNDPNYIAVQVICNDNDAVFLSQDLGQIEFFRPFYF